MTYQPDAWQRQHDQQQDQAALDAGGDELLRERITYYYRSGLPYPPQLEAAWYRLHPNESKLKTPVDQSGW